MKIMVFDIAAEHGGALSILHNYYNKAVKDQNNSWIFIISTPVFVETVNVKVINYPWTKKSWFHRLLFDQVIAHKLVNQYSADKVISLQNVIIPHTKIKQTVYLHQPLPFVEKKYNIFENFNFWMYQNIISRFIHKSLKEADGVIVQTEWLKNEVINRVGVSEDKITIQRPEISITIKDRYNPRPTSEVTFFYPASGIEYKNHDVILSACRILEDKGVVNYKVIFTLNEKDSKYTRKLYNIVSKENLPVHFIGSINRDKVYKYYTESVLLFASYIETFGLPLLEAKMHNTPIIASDCNFSHEILFDYDKVTYFNPFDEKVLANKMQSYIHSRENESFDV